MDRYENQAYRMSCMPENSCLRFSFIPDTDELRGPVLMAFEKGLKAVSVKVRASGVFEGIVAHKAPVRMMEGHKVRAQPESSVPAVKENAGIAGPGSFIVGLGIHKRIHRKAPAPEAEHRGPDAGAQIAVDQGKLGFIIGNQVRDILLIAQNLQGIVGGNPAAAGGSTGAQTVAPLILRNIPLVADELIHGLWGDSPGYSHPGFRRPDIPSGRRGAAGSIPRCGGRDWGRRRDFSAAPGIQCCR